MCGFAGFINLGAQPRPREERLSILARMGRQIVQRGPDDEQVFDDGVLSLIYRRLAIVDVEHGRQPLWNETRTAFVAINGEIYNHLELRQRLRERHRFATRSDSEIVVHLFEEKGIDLLELLNGMFAIALWDSHRQTLYLARDRLGIKPLYYARTPGGLLFGSELKALLAHPDCPDEFDWRDVDLGYLDGEMYTALNFSRVPTFVAGIDQLPGGMTLRVGRDEGLTVSRYWSIDDAIGRSLEAPAKELESHVQHCAALIEDSVEKRMMSDVPIGVFLSGGLDSSAIAAVACRSNPDLHCFTVHERTTVAAGDVERAGALAGRLNLPWHPVVYDHRQFAEQLDFNLDRFEYFIWMIDAPRFAPEAFFKHELHRYAKTVVPEIKVMLLGQGIDEFAGGYSQPMGAPPRDWSEYEETSLARSHRAHGLAAKRVHSSLAPYLRDNAAMSHDDAPFHREMRHRIWSLQSHNLWNEDRVSSSQGVEARVPFLDHRIVEYLAAIPAAQHAELFLDKWVIRQAMRKWLGETFTVAPKVPFWESGDTHSVHDLMYQCTMRVYPEFREAYTGSADDLFSAAALDELHQGSLTGQERRKNTKLILACMAVAVFNRLCRELRNDKPVTRLRPPSPLRVATG